VPFTAATIKQRALELGFDACGIAPASHLPELAFFEEWLARGYAGEMTFLERSAAQRADIRAALPSARSVIVTATLYNTDRPFTTAASDPAAAQVARYAWGDDYHRVVMGRLDALVAWMHEVDPQPFEAAPYVDTGPVQERVFARHAGIGWIGKNCCVIHPRLGSFIFLAEILCSLPLAPDAPALDQCGDCTRCLEACPTGALVGPGALDARRCISYLTIEHRGEIAAPLDQLIGNHVYGCDICQEVCPWNQGAPVSLDPAWQPRPFWDGATIARLDDADDRTLRNELRGSAMERARVSGLRRNVRIARRNQRAGERR
jgi:epoxyqueuosine reductase